jgi:hypothetical protein
MSVYMMDDRENASEDDFSFITKPFMILSMHTLLLDGHQHKLQPPHSLASVRHPPFH